MAVDPTARGLAYNAVNQVSNVASGVLQNAAQTAADRVQTGLDRIAADASANAASRVSASSGGVYPNPAANNVPRGLTQASVGTITAGSGGTNGTFALGWSGGNFSINPTGTFTVAGGALTAVNITGPGLYIGSSPTIPTPSFSASSGLTGAAVALTIQFLVTSGQGYWVQSSDGTTLDRYNNVSGTATADSGVKSLPSATVLSPSSITISRALTASDSRRIILANMPGPGNSAVNPLIVPSNSVNPLPIGTSFEIVKTGGSSINFTPDSTGSAVITTPSSNQIALTSNNGWCRLLKENTDNWRLYGDLYSLSNTAITAKIWFDASDLSSMKQERTGAAATTAAVVGQPVGSWRNKGTLGGWAVIDADSKRPTLQKNNGFYELVFDGVDDVLRLRAPALNLAQIEIYMGVRYTGVGGAAAFSVDGALSLAPAVGNDYNQNSAMAFYISSSGTQYNWVGGNTNNNSTMIVSARGVMTKRPHTIELRVVSANSATMTIDGSLGNGQISQSNAVTSYGTQGGDLIIGARQGNGITSWGKVAFTSIVITNQPVVDPSIIRSYEETNTYGTVPVYPNIANTTDLTGARNTLINELFRGAGIPSEIATLAIENPNPLNGVTTFTNLSKCEKMTMSSYPARPRLWTPGTPRNDVIFFVVAGHDAGWAGNGISQFVMQPLLTANVRICTFVLPGGPNDYTSGGPTQHESGAYTLDDWVGPVSIAINTLQSAFPSAAIYMTGISGGGWTTTICAAAESRITKSYQFVGTLPDMIYINRDFEQRLNGLTADFLTMYMLAACPGRRHMQVLYENDPVAFNRANFSTRPDYSAQMVTRCAAIGSGDYDLNWVNYNQHSYDANFSTLVLSELP